MENLSTRHYVFISFIIAAIFLIYKLGVYEWNDLNIVNYHFEERIETLTPHQKKFLANYAGRMSYPTIYAVTITKQGILQKVLLSRIYQTLALVPNVHWIVVEDAKGPSDLVQRILKSSNLPHTQLAVSTAFKPNILHNHVELDQRNMALKWLRKNRIGSEGVVYFMDVDKTYSLEVFQEVANVKDVGLWILDSHFIHTPIRVQNSAKRGMETLHNRNRYFPLDVSGFAINLKRVLQNPDVQFTYASYSGNLEIDFMSFFTTTDYLKGLVAHSTKTYIWHTKIQEPVINHITKGIEV